MYVNKTKLRGNGQAMLGSLFLSIVYTNKFTLGHVKLNFGLKR